MKTYLRFPHDYFELFQTETVLASEVLPSDLIKHFSGWGLVTKNEYDGTVVNNGLNQKLTTMEGTVTYLNPNDEVTIILRSLINQVKFEELLVRHSDDQAERARLKKEKENYNKTRLNKKGRAL